MRGLIGVVGSLIGAAVPDEAGEGITWGGIATDGSTGGGITGTALAVLLPGRAGVNSAPMTPSSLTQPALGQPLGRFVIGQGVAFQETAQVLRVGGVAQPDQGLAV